MGLSRDCLASNKKDKEPETIHEEDSGLPSEAACLGTAPTL